MNRGSCVEGTVEKDGEDLVLTLPQEVMDEAGLKIGDVVDISVKGGKMVIVRSESPGPP